jgi:hypothetical protein
MTADPHRIQASARDPKPASPNQESTMRRVLSTTIRWVLAAGATLAVSPAIAAQAPSGPDDSLPPVHAVRLTSPVSLDGALTDPAWQGAPGITRLVQSQPLEDAAATESTWVWIAYDDEALYVAARMWDSHPDSIIAPYFRRDDFVPSDFAGVILDPFNDHRTGYEFVITPSGAIMDATMANDGEEDASWDGVWEGRVRRDPQGWTCEMRIPFSQLRFAPGERQVWGVNFARNIARRAEKSFVVIKPKAESGFQSRFPHLVDIEGVKAGRTVELSPYVTGKAEYLVRPTGDPFNDGSRYTPTVGGDLRTSLGSNLTLNATVNPDFGQVEVDPAIVNLSDVESFYQEKRPFFTENSRVFSFGADGPNDSWGMNWPQPTFFYSRRIGRAPQGGVPPASDPDATVFADVPMATHILGAAKLTGRPAPGWNFGTLQALTSRERAKVWTDGFESRTEIEPLTWYGMVRGQREFKDGRNGLGLLSTLAQRRFGDGGVLENDLNRQSLMAGLDGWHFLDPKKGWVLSGWSALSRVAGTVERMQTLQRDPRHYFQRPDAGYLGVKDVPSLTGFAGRLSLNKQEGNVAFNSAVGVLDPKFDVSDLGYQSYADLVNAHVMTGYKWTKANRWQTESRLCGYLASNWDFGGEWVWSEVGATGHITFVNNHKLDAMADWFPEATANRQTRGGPRMLRRAAGDLGLHYDTDENRRLQSCTNAGIEVTPATDSYGAYVTPALAWKPSPRLYLSFGPTLERNVVDAQYVTSVEAPTGEVPADFGGRRYVFARLDQTTVAASIRLNVTFTPNLSLQTYVQPYISAGAYTDFKELARAGSYEFIHYGPDAVASPEGMTVTPAGGGTPFAFGDPSFNFKSLRGNAVLRWEYRPGSVLYFVWTQERSDEEALGDLRFGSSTRRLFDAQADDIFLVKATYYLDL